MHKFVNRFYWKNSKATSRPVSKNISQKAVLRYLTLGGMEDLLLPDS